eukprot:403371466
MKHLLSKQRGVFGTFLNQTRQAHQFQMTFNNGLLFRTITSRIFVEGLPADFNTQEIANHFKLAGEVQDVNLVRNSMGQNTGKALVTFKSKSSADQALQKFNNNAVNDLILNVKPYLDKKGDLTARTMPELIKRRIYLMNVPYDAHPQEIEALVKQFVPVDEVVLPKDRSGRPKGYAFVYLKDARDLDKAIEYIDGRHIRNRQLRAQKQLTIGQTQEPSSMDEVESEQAVKYIKFVRNSYLVNAISESPETEHQNKQHNTAYRDLVLTQVEIYARENNLSLEESHEKVLQQLKEMDNSNAVQKLQEEVQLSRQARDKAHSKWTEEERNKYPATYMAEQLQEQLMEAVNLPKELLYPGEKQMHKPLVRRQVDMSAYI